jgi:flavin reductase (DIM6/NTAB) family NADH-FMN oxidoreductase RutF
MTSVGTLKDTSRRVLETKECTINVVSEHFVEAANYTSVDAPPGLSERELSGLTPAKSGIVNPPRVAEAIFSVEARLVHTHGWFSPSTGRNTGMLAIVEGVYFHVRNDALNGDQNVTGFKVLQPVNRLSGITVRILFLRAATGYKY